MTDRFLSLDAANAFIDLFASVEIPKDLAKLQEAFLKVCHSYSLCGGEIQLIPYPDRLGRAADKSSFLLSIVSANSIMRSRIEYLLQRLESGTLSRTNQREISSLFMSMFAAWVTWDKESNGAESPFAFLKKKSSYDVRNALGLPIDRNVLSRAPIVIFEYSSINVDKLYRPTTADAAAYPRFAVRSPPPPEDSDWYGLTMPWQDNPHDDPHTDSNYPPRRPEALHHRIKFPAVLKCEVLYDVGRK